MEYQRLDWIRFSSAWSRNGKKPYCEAMELLISAMENKCSASELLISAMEKNSLS